MNCLPILCRASRHGARSPVHLVEVEQELSHGLVCLTFIGGVEARGIAQYRLPILNINGNVAGIQVSVYKTWLDLPTPRLERPKQSRNHRLHRLIE